MACALYICMKIFLYKYSSFVLVSLLFAALSCGGGDGDPAEYEVTGTVVDFATGQALTGDVTITVDDHDIDPAPAVSVDGAKFTVSGVPEGASLTLVVDSGDGKHSTKHLVSVQQSDVKIDPVHVSQAHLDQLTTEFDVMPDQAAGIVIVRAVDKMGNPVADVPAAEFGMPDALVAYFLDDKKVPDNELIATSSSGLFVVFDIDPGSFTINAANSESTCRYEMTMQAVTITASTITFVDLTVTSPPKNVSFRNSVVPIFDQCNGCHTDVNREPAGGMSLVGDINDIHETVLEGEDRVKLDKPGQSWIVQKPLGNLEHKGGMRISKGDNDHCTILAWIREGAKNN